MSFKFPKIDAASVQERFKENLKGKVKQTTDPRFYVLTKDNGGNGSAVIRFLPGKVVDGKEKLSYSVIYRHNLQLNKNAPFLSAVCPTTHGHRCPICEWTKLQDENWVKTKNLYKKRKYISNILVIEEKIPELIGEVKLFEYGPQVMKILDSKIYPKQIGMKKKDPMIYFDWEQGANFELILSKDSADSFPTWSNSEFLAQSSIMEFLDSANIDPRHVVDALYDTDEIVQNIEVPSYEELSNELRNWLADNNLPISGPVDSIGKETKSTAINLQTAKKGFTADNIATTAVQAIESESVESDEEMANEIDSVADREAPTETTPVSPVPGQANAKKFKDFRNMMQNKDGKITGGH